MATLQVSTVSNFMLTFSDKKTKVDSQKTFFDSQSLAKMHALVIAMRRKQPDIFNSKINPYLKIFPRSGLNDHFKVNNNKKYSNSNKFFKSIQKILQI